MQRAIKDQFSALEGDITIQAYSVQRTAETGAILLSDSLYEVINATDRVAHIFPQVKKSVLFLNPSEDAFEGVGVLGYDTAQYDRFVTDYVDTLAPSARYGSLVSSALAAQLNLNLGDTATLISIQSQNQNPRLRKSVVTGIFETPLEEFNLGHIVMSIEDTRRLNGWKSDSVSSYTVVLHEDEGRETMAAYWNAIVPYDLQVQSLEYAHPAIFGWLELFDTNILLVLGIVLIVALTNLITALLVLIIDRTRMIGTLKALGASDQLILQVFQWLSLRILLTGLFWGNLIGLGASYLQYQFGWVELDPSTYYISKAPIHFDLLWILGANAAFVGIAFVVLRVPVRWVAKIDPIKSIRFS